MKLIRKRIEEARKEAGNDGWVLWFRIYPHLN